MESFVENPNLPKNPISLAVVDGRIPYDIEKALYDLRIKIIKTTKNKYIYDAISFHPDVMMNHLGGRDIVVAKNIADKIIYSLEEEGFNIIYGKSYVEGKYPFDIRYNAASFGNYAVCCIKYTDEILLEELYKRNKRIIDVKQGYSKCSICVVAESSVITQDRGIYNILQKNKIDSLLITPGKINLFEMDYGFIGGASGCISGNEVAFFGDLSFHPNYNEIKNYMSKFTKKIKKLSKNQLTDFGTLIPLREYSILTI